MRLFGAFDHVFPMNRRGRRPNRLAKRTDPLESPPEMFCAVYRLIENRVFDAECFEAWAADFLPLQPREPFFRVAFENTTLRRARPVTIADRAPIAARAS